MKNFVLPIGCGLFMLAILLYANSYENSNRKQHKMLIFESGYLSGVLSQKKGLDYKKQWKIDSVEFAKTLR